MIDWNNIIERSHGMAVAKGWWDEPRSVEECLMLAVTEVAEAVEWYRDFKGDMADVFKPHLHEPCGLLIVLWENRDLFDGTQNWKPVGIPSELADVCIRVCDLMGHRGWAWSKVKANQDVTGDFLSYCFRLCGEICGDYCRKGDEQCSDIIAATERIAAHYGIDLATAIETKLAYNATRPHRHGGKKA